MAVTFKLPDSVYREGADEIAAVRRKNEPAVVVQDIERMLRAYVDAALLGKWPKDFTDMMPEPEKTKIVNAVVAHGWSGFAIRLSAARVLVNLQLLEVLAARGQVSPALAAPIEWARRGIDYGAQAPPIRSKDIATAFGDVVSKFFSGIIGGGGMLPIAALVAVVALWKKR